MTWADLINLLAYVVGVAVFWWAAKQRSVGTEGFARVAIAGAVGGMIGAKVSQWVFTGIPLSGILSQPGGKSLLGGILVGWIAVEVTKRRIGLKRSTGDLFAFALPAGEAVGRIGCWISGCCFGKPWSGPWAIYQHNAWRHPTQAYSLIACLIMLAVLLCFPRLGEREGLRWQAYLMMFGVSRFGIEMFREVTPVWGGLTAMQWMCLEMLVAGLVMMVWSFRTHQEKVPT